MSIIIFLSGFTLIIIGLAIITFRLKKLVIKNKRPDKGFFYY